MHLLLHIGPPKTGSTSIQGSLELNKGALKEAGILPMFYRVSKENTLPLHALGVRHKTDRALKHWPFPQMFETPQAAREWSDGHWQNLAETVRQSDVDLCVISSEHLSYGVDMSGLLADLRKIFSGITMLAYARDPASLYFSSMQEQLKSGKRLFQLNTPQGSPYRHRKVIEDFANELGAENVVVRNFSRDNLVGRDVVQDFFAQFERFGKILQVVPVQTNESIPGAALALLMLINEANTPGEKPRQRIQLIRRMRTSKSVAQLPSFPPEMPWVRTMIRARAAEDCAWLNENFLSGQELLHVETGPMPEYPGDDVWRATLRDALLAYLTPEALAVLGPEIVK